MSPTRAESISKNDSLRPTNTKPKTIREGKENTRAEENKRIDKVDIKGINGVKETQPITYNRHGFLGSDPQPTLTYPKANTPKKEKFYTDTRDQLIKARNGDERAETKVKKLASDKKQWGGKIRSNTLTLLGAKRGNGEDEVFQTSETPQWMKRSAGLIKDKHATSYHLDKSGKEREFDWMDAQLDIRHPTQFQVYNTGGGHSGALYRQASPSKSGILKGQPEAHKARNEEILRSSTPRNGILRGLRADLELTPNAENFDKVINQGYDYKDRNMRVPKDKKAFKAEYLQERARKKETYTYIRDCTYNDEGASEVSSYELSSDK